MKKLLFILPFFYHLCGLTAQHTPFTEKLFVNFELSRQAFSVDEPNTDTDGGGGLGLRLGYGFTPTFSLYLGFTGASMTERSNANDRYGLGVAELGTRLHFGRKLKSPTFYLDVAFQAVEASDDDSSLSFSGGGLGLGGGLLVFVGQKLALDFGLRGSGGTFSDFTIGGVTVNIDEENVRYGVGRLSVGITWFPMRD